PSTVSMPPRLPSPALSAHIRTLSAAPASAARAGAPHLLDGVPRPDRLGRLPPELAGFVRSRAAGHTPSQFAYGNALAACTPAAGAGSVAFAEQLYCAAWKDGLAGDAYVCSGMVDLLAKSGRLGDALRAFADGDRGSAVCWNAVISGAARNGEHGLAVEMFGDMAWGSCEPNSFTYSGVLSACAAGAELCVGKAVHGLVLRRDPEYDVFIGTAIVNMYAKSGDMVAAMREFWRMPVRNVVSWTTAIAGFVQQEEPLGAVRLLRDMVRGGVSINKYTATSILLACSQMHMIREASQIHGMIIKTELYLDYVVKEALICTYANIGAIDLSEKVFEEVGRVSNKSIWSTFISGISSHNLPRSIQLLTRMFRQGLRPNDKCYASIFSSVDSTELGRQLHSLVIKDGFVHGVLVGSALSTMYSRCGEMEDSCKVFEEMQERDEVSWTAMIAGFASHGHSDEAFRLFRNMILDNLKPDHVSLSAILSACNGPEYLLKGKEVHGHILRVYGETTSVSTCLVSMYSKCREVQTARRIFDATPCKDQVMLSSMVSGYSTNGCTDEAISLFQLMMAAGFQIDRFICSSILSLCANIARPLYGKLLHGYATKAGILSDLSVSSSLVKLYSKNGNLHDSRKVFDEINSPDLVTWTAIIDGYAQHGSGQDSLEMFDLMIRRGVKPDNVVLVSILSACSRNGLVEEGFNYFKSMRNVYGLEPVLHHYCCMVDLLGRSGRLAEAKSFIESMPMKPDLMVWSTLLAACRVHEDAVLGRFVENKIREDNYDPSSFAMLSNILANSGDWEEVARVRKSLKSSKKEPGLSMV
uniref:Pentacotripeptide-repeat region of PRORP domain-containing protein n=9 Tax=Triticinae TaxID=1648030 RepID=A0A453KY83_AEGTS